jgi:hypothetical protein
VSDQPSSRLRVYLAGPMTVGDPMENIHNALRLGRQMVRDGLAPYIPQLDAYMMWWDTADYEALLDWDFAWVQVSDALFRMPGDSSGADREVALARSLDIPVFTVYADLLEHAGLGPVPHHQTA